MQRILALIGVIALVGAAVIIRSSGAASYVIRVPLADADGLQNGSQVVRGGTQIGTVQLKLLRGDQVQARLDLDASHSPIPKNSEIAISAVNLLGLKQVQVIGGSVADPAPDGYTMPSRQVMVGTDLDQVLDLLAPASRARLAILLDEAGEAVMGRKADISAMLEQLPPTLQDGTQLLGALSANTTDLSQLVTRSGTLVTALAQHRTDVQHMISSFARLTSDFAQEPVSVAGALDRAPGALAGLRALLGQLHTTAVTLRPAAEDIVRTAPLITGVLGTLPSVRAAALPALHRAVTVSPILSAFATTATPILRQAAPTVTALAGLSQALTPVSKELDLSAANIFAIIGNWAHAVEGRDSLGHVFRGEASFTPQAIMSILRQPPTNAAARARARRQAARHPAGHPAATPAPATPKPAAAPPPAPASNPLAGLTHALGLPNPTAPSHNPAAGLRSLLNYLLK